MITISLSFAEDYLSSYKPSVMTHDWLDIAGDPIETHRVLGYENNFVLFLMIQAQ